MKKCPYCAEDIQDEAIVCRYCGRELAKPVTTPQPAIQQTNVQAAKPNKRKSSLLGKLVLAVVTVCLALICVIAVMRTLGGSVGQAQPTATAEISSSVVISTFTTAPSMTPPPTHTPRPSPTLNIGMINEPREAGGIVLTVLDVTRADRMDFLTADQGYTYLILDVTIENVGRTEESPYNPLYFSVKDSDGYEYNASLFARDPSLKSGKLFKGEKVRGFVAFEVRSISDGLVVTYEPLVLLGGYEPIRIALDRLSLANTAQETPVNSPCESCSFECPGNQGEFEFCIVDPELVIDKNQFERILQEYCKTKGGGFCKMLVWTDRTYLPDFLPMSEVQLNNQVADYTRNISTGLDCLKLLSGGSVIYSSNGCK